jgi:hypothetical protein
MVRLVLLFGPLLSLLSMATSGTARLRGDHDDEVDAVVVDAHAVSHAHGHDDDPDRGYRTFGRVIEMVTILGVLVVALLVVGLILSIFGVFGSDVWDPPV